MKTSVKYFDVAVGP